MQPKRPTLALKKGRSAEDSTPAPEDPKGPVPDDKSLPAAERRRRSQAKSDAATSVLRAAYPALFDSQKPVPLALGIITRLNEERRAGRLELSAIPLRLALNRWVTSTAYIAALAAGGQRMGLDGLAAEAVTEDQRAAAQAQLSQRQAKKTKKRDKGSAKK